MKQFTVWGFTRAGWKQGQRGEYWVVAQAVLMIGFVLLPAYCPIALSLTWQYWCWGTAAVLGILAILFVLKGLLDLGQSLTPLPYPRDDGQLVQSGIYAWVRHPIYSGVIFAALAWAIAQVSLSHFLGAILFFLFFDAKSRREENWLVDKYADYATYRQQVKKFFPRIY
jgi:protein-S-isoprenylcysteine O-methyltransferase Ste14